MARRIETDVRIKKSVRTSYYKMNGEDIGYATVDYNMSGANNVCVYSTSGELIRTTNSQVEARNYLADLASIDQENAAVAQ